jgi:hypothetical protein
MAETAKEIFRCTVRPLPGRVASLITAMIISALKGPVRNTGKIQVNMNRQEIEIHVMILKSPVGISGPF